MPRQAKSYLSILLAFALLVTVLMQSSCKKAVLSREEFINEIKGKWYVLALNHSLTPNNPIWVEIQVYVGGVFYSTVNEQKTYPFNDSILCTLPHIEKMQNWTINESNGDLFLETKDLCGDFRNYKMEFSNYRYHTTGGIGAKTDGIDADINLVNQDAIITLNSFSLRWNTNPIEMCFKVVTSNSKDSFNFRRPE